MKRPPTDVIDLTGDEDQKNVQIVSDSAKPPPRSTGKSSSRATSKSRDELDDNKPKAKKRRKMNGEEVDAADSGRSRGPSRASSKAPSSSKGKTISSQPADSVHVVAPEPKASEGPTISVGAENVEFFIDTHGDQSLQLNGAPSNQIIAEVPHAEENAGPSQEPKPSDDQNPSVNGRVVVPAPKKRSKSKTPKSQPQSADGSDLSTSGAASPPGLPDIEEEGAGQPESNVDKPKQLSKTAAKKARRRERERLAAESAAGAGGQVQDIPIHALPPDGGSPPPFFEDVEGITVAGHLQPDPIEEPLPAFVTVDGLTLPRHVKLAKDDTKTKADEAAEGGRSDESSSEESDDDIESDDDDDRPKKGRRYWLTEEQLAAIPPCGVCGEQGHDFRDCTHLKCTQCGALDDHESNKCPLFVTCWKCGEKGHVSVECRSAPNRSYCHHCGSRDHLAKHCHTLWRTYTYLQPEDRDLIVAGRRALEGVPLLQGGEGYIGTARWCCICGDSGHFGFDCDNLEHPLRKKGPMAFSDELLRKGPFANARLYLSRHNHDPTANGVHTYFSDVPGPSMPTNPGAQGKKKQQQQMQKARRNDDEGDDWFDRRDNRAASSSKGKSIDIEIKGFREREDARRQREEMEVKRRVDDERRRRDRSRERYRDDERDSYRNRDQDYRRRDYDREYYDSRRERLDDGRRGHDRYYDDRRSSRRERSPPRKGKSLIDRMSLINLQKMASTLVNNAVVKFSGHEHLRNRIVLSLLSGKPIRIDKIRSDDKDPGLRDYEVSLLRLLETICNGMVIEISYTGTSILIKPGIINGGQVTHECPTSRSVGYFLEPVLMLAPFAKKPLNLTLTGVTTDDKDLSVDLLRTVTLPHLQLFGISEGVELKIKKRGAPPLGGGEVQFSCPIVRNLKIINFMETGKVKRIRGIAHAVRVSPQLSHRMVEAARSILNRYIPDIYIHTDVYKGQDSGKSPGFALTLLSESTTSAIHCAEAVSQPGATPEDVALVAARLLLSEVRGGGCVDQKHQCLVMLMMVLGTEDVGRCRIGPLSERSIQFMRDIRDVFGTTFKVVPADPSDSDSKELVISCYGTGYVNSNRSVA